MAEKTDQTHTLKQRSILASHPYPLSLTKRSWSGVKTISFLNPRGFPVTQRPKCAPAASDES